MPRSLASLWNSLCHQGFRISTDRVFFCPIMCFEAPLSISHVSSPGATGPESAENSKYSSTYYSFVSLFWVLSFTSSSSSSARWAWCIFVFLLWWTLSGKVSYLMIVIALILGVIFLNLNVFSFILKLIWRFMTILLDVWLFSSFSMDG